MAERDGYYWDYQECGWVRCEPARRVEIPAQPTVPGLTGIAVEREADVRSG